jgi:hypothetical protein
MSLRVIARQFRRMLSVHALATRLPRRCAPRNDMVLNRNDIFLNCSSQ